MNGHFGCSCYHPLFLFNQHGQLERDKLRPCNVHSADGLVDVLKPVMARYAEGDILRLFRADAAFARPALYTTLEAEGYFYVIRLPTTAVLQQRIAHVLKRPVGRPPNHGRRRHADFEYQAGSWDLPRRVLAKMEWHSGEWFPRLGFIVNNLPLEPEQVFGFYNQRGTAEQCTGSIDVENRRDYSAVALSRICNVSGGIDCWFPVRANLENGLQQLMRLISNAWPVPLKIHSDYLPHFAPARFRISSITTKTMSMEVPLIGSGAAANLRISSGSRKTINKYIDVIIVRRFKK